MGEQIAAEHTIVPESTTVLVWPAPLGGLMSSVDVVPRRDELRPSTVPEEFDRRTRKRGWLVRRALVVADVVGFIFAFILTQLAFPGAVPEAPDRVALALEFAVFFLLLPAWILIAKIYGLYDRDEGEANHTTVDDASRVFHALTLGTWLLVAVCWATNVARPGIGKLVVFWAVAAAGVLVARGLARWLCRRHAAYAQRALIVGAGHVGQLIARKFRQHDEYGVDVVGFIDATPRELRAGVRDIPILGTPDDVAAIVERLDIDRVIVAFSGDDKDELVNLIRSLNGLWVQVDIVPRLFDLVGPGVGMHSVEGIPLIGLRPSRLSGSSRVIKRAVDLAVAAGALVVLTPLFLLIAAAIKLDSRGSIFFRQLRKGREDKTFRIYKFRTMVPNADLQKAELAYLNKYILAGEDPRMFKIEGDPRVTRVGRVLRRYSLDELPQLFNVLRGEMSLVGPRPLVLNEADEVEGWARHRLALKPGITGLWQVLGRNNIPFDEMIRLDYIYVTQWSLAHDLRLLCRTLPVLARGGARQY